MNYNNQMISARMGLGEALQSYSGEIQFVTLKDGTNIEIIPNNPPEMAYMDNQFQNEFENQDDFVEEKVGGNIYNLNYQQVEKKQPGPLRGKKKVLGKPLRKTVLKSIDGTQEEKSFDGQGKLRNLKNNANPSLNEIIHFTENNDFLQCANCFKFFVSNEKEGQNTTQNTGQKVNSNQQIPMQNQQIPKQNQQKSPYPQQFPQQPPHHNQKHPQQPPHHNQKQPQQPYPNQQFPNYPNQNYPPNMNKGFPQKPNQPQQMYQQVQPGKQVNPNKKKQQPQQFYQQMPGQQFKGVTFQQNQYPGQKNVQGFYPGMPNQPMNMQFRGQNQVFKARKKDIEIETNELDDDNYYDNNVEQNYYYPVSAKKVRSNKNIYVENPINKRTNYNIDNRGLPRNLSYGFKKNISSNREMGYIDNNLTEYVQYDDSEYYQYPQYQKNNMIPFGKSKNVNNHRVVNVKVTRNVPYQYQEYQDYYDDYVDYEN